MIYISEDELSQVEYLIEQSKIGNHVLFNLEDVRRIFHDGIRDLEEAESYAVEHHIEKLISLPTLIQKKAYLDKLESGTFELVVRTYFNIVENDIFEKRHMKH